MWAAKDSEKRKHRRRAHAWGFVAEYLCAFWLVCKGYTILYVRHRSFAGEIDIVAARGKLLAIVEVKARANARDAIESVTADKQRRIARAAEAFVGSHPKFAQHGLRFDVMMVTSPWKIHHLKDAWRL